MIRRTLYLALISLFAAACSADGPRVISDLEEMRVVKVSGDQSAPVPAVAPSRIVAVAGTSLDAAPGDGWTPEPLVARVVPEATAGRGITGSGPVIPAGTLVHWQIPEGAGRLYGQTTTTVDSASVVNRWAPGTRAGTYTVAAGRLVGSNIVTDATWEVVVEPGPVAIVERVDGFGPSPYYLPDVLLPQDEHRNVVPFTLDLQDHPTITLAGESGDDARTLIGTGDGCGPIRIVVADKIGRAHV